MALPQSRQTTAVPIADQSAARKPLIIAIIAIVLVVGVTMLLLFVNLKTAGHAISFGTAGAGQAGIFLATNTILKDNLFNIPIKANLGDKKSTSFQFVFTFDHHFVFNGFSQTPLAKNLQVNGANMVVIQNEVYNKDSNTVIVTMSWLCADGDCSNALTGNDVTLGEISLVGKEVGMGALTFSKFDVYDLATGNDLITGDGQGASIQIQGQDVCSPVSLQLCTTPELCASKGLFWYNNACHVEQLVDITGSSCTTLGENKLINDEFNICVDKGDGPKWWLAVDSVCTADALCTKDALCKDSKCKLVDGAACTVGAFCVSNNCVNGVCAVASTVPSGLCTDSDVADANDVGSFNLKDGTTVTQLPLSQATYININQKGEVKGKYPGSDAPSTTISDTCNSQKIVQEFYCDLSTNEISWYLTNCPSGTTCQDGACIKPILPAAPCDQKNPSTCHNQQDCNHVSLVWDSTTNSCSACPAGSAYNPATATCGPATKIKIDLLDPSNVVVASGAQVTVAKYTVKATITPGVELPKDHLVLVSIYYGDVMKTSFVDHKPEVTAAGQEVIQFTHDIAPDFHGDLKVQVYVWNNWPLPTGAFDALIPEGGSETYPVQ